MLFKKVEICNCLTIPVLTLCLVQQETHLLQNLHSTFYKMTTVFHEEDNTFKYIAKWCTHIGAGHWCGYVAHKDDTKTIDVDDKKFHGGCTGGLDGGFVGFDTLHFGDANTGPDGEVGLAMFETEITWTKVKVFEHLKEVVAELE